MSLMITCPICGMRSGYEFRYGGEDKGPRPDEAALTPEDWCAYVHMNRSPAGVVREWWSHRDGCGAWFCIERDTRINVQVGGIGPLDPKEGSE